MENVYNIRLATENMNLLDYHVQVIYNILIISSLMIIILL